MKSCPTCNRTFEDTLTYCLVDGAILSAPFDPHATLIIPEARPTEPPPTEVLRPQEEIRQEIPPTTASPQPNQKPREIPSTKAAPIPAVYSPQIQALPMQTNRRSNRLPLILISVGALLLIGLIVFIIANRRSGTNEPSPSTDASTRIIDGNANRTGSKNGPPRSVGALPKYIDDSANVIDGSSKMRLEETLNDLKRRRGVDFFVITVKTTGVRDISDYTRTAASERGLRGDRSGVLLLLAVADRKYHFDLSKNLESALPDSYLSQSGRLMVPSLREGKYGEGILKAVNSVIAKLEEQDIIVSQ